MPRVCDPAVELLPAPRPRPPRELTDSEQALAELRHSGEDLEDDRVDEPGPYPGTELY